MNHKMIQDTAKRHTPKKHSFKKLGIAFLSGGILAVIAQGVFEFYRVVCMVANDMAVSMTMVTIIIITSIATGFGIYDKIAQTCGAGLFVPISGFANSLTSAAMEGRSEGLIYGIGSHMFSLAGSVLTYGISAAFVFGLLRYLFFGG